MLLNNVSENIYSIFITYSENSLKRKNMAESYANPTRLCNKRT